MKPLELKTDAAFKHIKSTPDLHRRQGNNNERKAYKAAKQFESLLTAMMVKSMTKASGGMFGGEGLGGDMFDTIFQNKLAEYISEKHDLGIAEAILGKDLGISKTQPIEKAEEAKPIIDFDVKAKPLSPSKSSMDRLKKYEHFIDEAAGKFGVDKNLIKSVILTESAANHKAISKVKAKGLMQLMDKTAKDMGVRNIWHPKENIFGGTKYLSMLLNKFDKDVKLSLAAYNAGPGSVEKYNGVPPFRETKNYINRVLGYYNYLNG